MSLPGPSAQTLVSFCFLGSFLKCPWPKRLWGSRGWTDKGSEASPAPPPPPRPAPGRELAGHLTPADSPPEEADLLPLQTRGIPGRLPPSPGKPPGDSQGPGWGTAAQHHTCEQRAEQATTLSRLAGDAGAFGTEPRRAEAGRRNAGWIEVSLEGGAGRGGTENTALSTLEKGPCSHPDRSQNVHSLRQKWAQAC